MTKQLYKKAFRALLALVLFAGAVTLTNAQTMPSSSDAILMLNVKLQQISGTTPVIKMSQANTLTPAQAQATYRYGFYNRITYKIKTGSTVDAAIDNAFTTLSPRNQAAANALRQEVIDYLTKS